MDPRSPNLSNRSIVRRIRNWLVAAACLLAVFFLGILVGKYIFELSEINIPADHFDELSLFTWKGRSDDICFLLVPRTEQGGVIRNFWSKWQGQCGLSHLKKTLTTVPKGKRVVWRNRPPKFELPSEKFCDEIVEFAKGNGVNVSVNPMLDVEMFSDWEPR